MKVLRHYRKEGLASIRVLDLGTQDRRGRPEWVELVESVQPPIPREEKWVLIVSTFTGCPVGCAMCDAGDRPGRPLRVDELWAQVELAVREHHPDLRLPQRLFKIQLSRMGEPALNPAILELLRVLPTRLDAPGLLPSLSTIAPAGREAFFEELLTIKESLYPRGRFQLQFSVHTTDAEARRRLIPMRTWDLAEMARYGARFFQPGDRRITLNFAATREHPIEADVLAAHFDPAHFLIKITPLNPTQARRRNMLHSLVNPMDPASVAPLVDSLKALGYEVIVSIGELDENRIGSNCGQFVTALRREGGDPTVRDGYEAERFVVAGPTG